MQKKIVVLLTLVLIFSVFSIVGAQEEVKEPNTFTFVTSGDQSTLDPHFSYDTASSEVIYQVYETLIDYDGESVQ
ncbi:MAG: hypothetical protein ACOC4L_04225 [Halanaerobium sp.]